MGIVGISVVAGCMVVDGMVTAAAVTATVADSACFWPKAAERAVRAWAASFFAVSASLSAFRFIQMFLK